MKAVLYTYHEVEANAMPPPNYHLVANNDLFNNLLNDWVYTEKDTTRWCKTSNKYYWKNRNLSV